MSGAEVPPKQTSVSPTPSPDRCSRREAPREPAGRPQVGSAHPGARGRRTLTHPRTRTSRTGWSCWTRPSPRPPRAAARSAPRSWPRRARRRPRPRPAHGEVPGARGEPRPPAAAALPAPPPGDACASGFRPCGRRCALSPGCRGRGGWGQRGRGEGRPERSDRRSGCGERPPPPRARRWDPGPPGGAPAGPACTPHPPPGSRLPGGGGGTWSGAARAQAAGDRQTARPPLPPPPQLRSRARTQRKEGRRGRSGGWCGCRGLDSSCSGRWGVGEAEARRAEWGAGARPGGAGRRGRRGRGASAEARAGRRP